MTDNSLGRGISDVLNRTIRRETPNRGFLEVDLGLIVPPSQNPRQHFDQSAIDELAASIAVHGVMQPIVVTKRDLGYEIVSGERRYRAAKQAGLTKIPVVLREGDDPQRLAELRLIENIQREDLNPLELADAYQQLIDQHGLTHDDLAKRLGKPRSGISNTLRLLSLPASIRPHLVSGAISQGHAKALLSAADPAWQATLAERVVTEGLSVRMTEALAKAGPPVPTAAANGPANPTQPPHIRELEANLKLLFGTTVQVREKHNGAGSMTLHFHSRDHFQRIVGLMGRMLDQGQR